MARNEFRGHGGDMGEAFQDLAHKIKRAEDPKYDESNPKNSEQTAAELKARGIGVGKSEVESSEPKTFTLEQLDHMEADLEMLEGEKPAALKKRVIAIAREFGSNVSSRKPAKAVELVRQLISSKRFDLARAATTEPEPAPTAVAMEPASERMIRVGGTEESPILVPESKFKIKPKTPAELEAAKQKQNLKSVDALLAKGANISGEEITRVQGVLNGFAKHPEIGDERFIRAYENLLTKYSNGDDKSKTNREKLIARHGQKYRGFKNEDDAKIKTPKSATDTTELAPDEKATILAGPDWSKILELAGNGQLTENELLTARHRAREEKKRPQEVALLALEETYFKTKLATTAEKLYKQPIQNVIDKIHSRWQKLDRRLKLSDRNRDPEEAIQLLREEVADKEERLKRPFKKEEWKQSLTLLLERDKTRLAKIEKMVASAKQRGEKFTTIAAMGPDVAPPAPNIEDDEPDETDKSTSPSATPAKSTAETRPTLVEPKKSHRGPTIFKGPRAEPGEDYDTMRRRDRLRVEQEQNREKEKLLRGMAERSWDKAVDDYVKSKGYSDEELAEYKKSDAYREMVKKYRQAGIKKLMDNYRGQI